MQRLLAFARRQPLQRTAVDVGQLVSGMKALLASTLGPRITLKVDLPQRSAFAEADPNQLEMALLNLVLNSRDAIADEGQVTIYHRVVDAGEPLLEIAVADTGAGMDEETCMRAVEPFFSTKGIGRGTGLGLSMVHGLAAQLGGELHLESAPGAGTTVRLRLPLSQQHRAGEEQEARPRLNAPTGVALLVDDEDLVRQSTVDMLADMGFEVAQECSAEAALRRLRSGFRPTILITDHLMPGMTGAALAKAARELQPELPALLISGYADVEGIAGDLPRLTKPFLQAELEASIAQL